MGKGQQELRRRASIVLPVRGRRWHPWVPRRPRPSRTLVPPMQAKSSHLKMRVPAMQRCLRDLHVWTRLCRITPSTC